MMSEFLLILFILGVPSISPETYPTRDACHRAGEAIVKAWDVPDKVFYVCVRGARGERP
jgi:hypothetical protein